MDIDRIIDNAFKSPENRDFCQDQQQKSNLDIENLKTKQELNNNFCTPEKAGTEERQELENKNIYELIRMDLNNRYVLEELYNRFESDIENRLNEYLITSVDENAEKGMKKCCLETWQDFIQKIGRNYFNRYDYLRKRGREGAEDNFIKELLVVGLQLYENLCMKYRKQFFIYDCCKFLGMSLDCMYTLNDLHADILKKAHTIQESSYRTALASGRSNVTAIAILLNHDYDYTRTTQVIHTTGNVDKSASELPQLEKIAPESSYYIEENL